MWDKLGGIIVSILGGVIGIFVEWRERRKMSQEASKGRAAAEYLKSEEAARKIEEEQRKKQAEIKKEDAKFDEDNLFGRD